jgi:hypothetical protein
MPRIEIDFVDQDKLKAFLKETGNGTSTFDVCETCANKFDTGEPWPHDEEHKKGDLSPYNGETDYATYPDGFVVGETEVEHPPYDDCDYNCCCCGGKLNEDDD